MLPRALTRLGILAADIIFSRTPDREIPRDRQCEICFTLTACPKLREIFGATFPAT